MHAKPRPRRFAPGLIRVPIGTSAAPLRGATFTPFSLTTADPPEMLPLGVIAPTGDAPWGCLFFTLVAVSLLIGLFSRNWAVLAAGVGLIAFWASYNHPRRVSAGQARRAFSLLGTRNARRAKQAVDVALNKQSDDPGLHYLAAIAEHALEHWKLSLDYLAESRSAMAVYAEFHHLMGRNQLRLGQRELARVSLEKTLEFPDYPGRRVLLEELAELYRALGDGAAAERAERDLGEEPGVGSTPH